MLLLEKAIQARAINRSTVVIAPRYLKEEFKHLDIQVRFWDFFTEKKETLSSLQMAFDAKIKNAMVVCVFPEFEKLKVKYNYLKVWLENMITNLVYKLIKAGNTIVSMLGDSIRSKADLFYPEIDSLANNASFMKAYIAKKPIQLFKNQKLIQELAIDAWEIEVTDPRKEINFQLPGGEIFTSFHCDWSGELTVYTVHENRFIDVMLCLKDGYIIAINCNVLSFKNLLGKKITEIGLGINSTIPSSPNIYLEKKWGLMHIGVGDSIENDISPPSLHTDFLINKTPLNINLTDESRFSISLF